MYRELLERQQPIVYRALVNALHGERVSNAYLFSGPFGTPKHEAALFLAESLFCEREGAIACEECNNCRRVREGLYADLIVLKGNEKPISKEDVDAIQEKFSKTALEKGKGGRVYIIENAENASVSAQNSLLKFLEEPGADVTAILTTDNIGRILPTIVSRCRILPFLPMDPEVYYEQAIKLGVGEDDAYFLSHIVRSSEDIMEMAEGEEYQKALLMLKQYLNCEGMRREELLVDYDMSYKSSDSDRERAKKANIDMLSAFFDLLSLYARDCISGNPRGPWWYVQSVSQGKGSEIYYGKLIMLANEQRDKVNRFNDLNLLMAQAFWRLEELDQWMKPLK